uniref:BTB domain-containing protein n=1 Tax=Davidia involucrata TaxID=16924 RepID=A0A5B6YHD9_DAVIN
MDCSICSAMPFILRPPRNTICGACYEGARSIITLTNKLDGDNKELVDRLSANATVSALNSSKGFANALKWVKEMKEMEEELNEKLTFLGGFVAALRDQIHTDIQVKPGNSGPSIPAHRALLAARSSIFKNMLDSDGCKAPPSDTITLPELNYEELESLLEFLYSGSLPREKVAKHVYSLSITADKYDIPFLQKFCEHQMLGSLNSANALDVLEISDVCSNQTLKETALNFIVKNMEDIVFSGRFEGFALKNPHLTVQITRASFMDIKNRRNGI